MRRALALGLAGVALLAAGLVLFRRPAPVRVAVPPPASAPVASAEPVRLACAFDVGDTLAFAVETTGTAVGPGAPAEGDRFAAAWSWQVWQAPAPGQWVVAMAFSSAELRQVLTEKAQRVSGPLDSVFLLRVDRDCRFVGVGLPKAWSVTTRRFVVSVVRSLETLVSSASTGATWEFTQSDGTGRYRASYQAAGLGDGTYRVTKTKRLYREGHGPKGLGIQPELVSGGAEGTFDARGRWFRALAGLERVRLRAEGRVIVDLALRTSVVRDDARFALSLPAGLSLADFSFEDPFTMEVAAERPVDPSLARLTLAEALARFAALYRRDGKVDAYAAARFLSDCLRARPGLAGELLAALRAGTVAEELRPALFLALEMCGTPQAHGVLVEALEDRRMAPMDRARAASALSDVPAPNAETLRSLAELARAPAAPDDKAGQLVAGGTLRALGHLGERAEKLDPAMQEQVRKELRSSLGSGGTVSRTIDVVDAMGNTGDEKLIPDVAAQLGGDSAAVREHAARALRRMDADQATPPLVAQLGSEGDPAVRGAIANTLASVHSRDAAAIALVARMLATEPNPAARAEFIRFLGSTLPDPVAKAALVAQFHRDTVPELLRLIGTFVTTDDLR